MSNALVARPFSNKTKKYTKDGFSSLRTFFSFAEMKNRLLCICEFVFGLKKSQP